MKDATASKRKLLYKGYKGFLSSCALEMCILSLLSRDDYYGYKLSKKISLEVSESTLYPVLRRLEDNHFLVSRKEVHNSKIRKVYSITTCGVEQFESLKNEWKSFSNNVNCLLDAR